MCVQNSPRDEALRGQRNCVSSRSRLKSSVGEAERLQPGVYRCPCVEGREAGEGTEAPFSAGSCECLHEVGGSGLERHCQKMG